MVMEGKRLEFSWLIAVISFECSMGVAITSFKTLTEKSLRFTTSLIRLMVGTMSVRKQILRSRSAEHSLFVILG